MNERSNPLCVETNVHMLRNSKRISRSQDEYDDDDNYEQQLRAGQCSCASIYYILRLLLDVIFASKVVH